MVAYPQMEYYTSVKKNEASVYTDAEWSPRLTVNLQRYRIIIFGGWDLDLNSGLCACKAGALLVSHTSSPLCSGYFGDAGVS
jgi:hypothetical protein